MWREYRLSYPARVPILKGGAITKHNLSLRTDKIQGDCAQQGRPEYEQMQGKP